MRRTKRLAFVMLMFSTLLSAQPVAMDECSPWFAGCDCEYTCQYGIWCAEVVCRTDPYECTEGYPDFCQDLYDRCWEVCDFEAFTTSCQPWGAECYGMCFCHAPQ